MDRRTCHIKIKINIATKMTLQTDGKIRIAQEHSFSHLKLGGDSRPQPVRAGGMARNGDPCVGFVQWWVGG
jgi:hypothetical protein